MLEEHKKPGLLAITAGSWVRLVLVLAAAYALYRIHGIILVIFTAIVIASSVEPAAAWAKRRGIPRLPTILFVYVSTGIILAGLFYFLLLPLIGDASDFIRTLPTDSNPVSMAMSGGSVLSDFSDALSIDKIATYLNSLITSLSQGVFSSVSLVFGGVVSFILIVVLSFYLAVQEDGIGKFLRAITPLRHEKYAISLWQRSRHKIGLWMQGQLLLGVMVLVLVYLGLTLIGLPHALLLAVMAGIFELIPIFGPIISAIPALFVAFTSDSANTALIVAGLYLIIQQFENHLIYPLVVKKVVGVPPMVSIIALLVGGQLAGFLGVIIAVPVAAVFMELLSDFEEHKIARHTEVETIS